jgi:predicted MFS family arabinose efflux permease
MKKIFASYQNLPASAWWLLGADVCLQLINSAFAILLNYVMIDHGYKDYDITSINGNRYLAVLICAYPLTILSRKIDLKKLLLIGAITSPLLSLAMLWCIHFHVFELLRITTFLWGVAFSLIQVLSLPILMKMTDESNQTEAISLFFAAGSFTMIFCGLLNVIIQTAFPDLSNLSILTLYCVLACVGPYFIFNIKDKLSINTKHDQHRTTKKDWKRIGEALLPTFLIAFGAGFTIPFINLFFNFVHGIDSATFSIMNTVAFLLVVTGGFLNPIIKRKYGYKFAITVFQVLAIIALFIMGTTEWYSGAIWASTIAVVMYVIRQPLMNVAGPLTTELSMKYVGEKNQKIISAITAALWSGTWYLSAVIFSILREMNISYSNIIFTTVFFYSLGVISYYRLIKKFEVENTTD